jgi:uncharacterized protein (TIGR03437 family)
MRAVLAQLPLSFEENRGQADGRVKFLARGNGYSLFLKRDEAVMVVGQDRSYAVVRMKPAGANPRAAISGADKLPGRSNYFVGSDPAKWRTNIPTYAEVRYRDVYPAIDLAYHGNGGALEHDWVVRPGGSPAAIRLRFSGGPLGIDEDGDLVIQTAAGEVRSHKPIAYQVVDGARRYVAADYVQTGSGEFAFQLGPYDPDAVLVIDPVVVYTALIGGGSFQEPFPGAPIAMAVDSAGNVYLVGFGGPLDLPKVLLGSTGGPFVLKVNAAGTAILFCTVISAIMGLGADIAVDSAGNPYVTGQAGSGFPTTPNAFQRTPRGPSGDLDAFVAKLSGDGSTLVYSTLLSGSSTDQASSIALDARGNAYVAGYTQSADFPLTQMLAPTCSTGGPYATNAYVAKVNSEGTGLAYSTCVGPSWPASSPIYSIAVDGAGSAYVAGDALPGFPTTPGSFQPAGAGDIVFKLNSAGSAFVYSTFLGTYVADSGRAIAVDPVGNVYAVGQLGVRISKLNAAGSALVYSTYLVGTGTDSGSAIAVDGAGNAYVVGQTSSTDFPVVDPVQATFANGAPRLCLALAPCYDALIAELDPAGSLIFSTYFGGGGDEGAQGGVAVAVDAAGNAYVAGYWGSGLAEFPAAGPIRLSQRGIFLLKLSARGSFPTFTAQSVTSAASFQPGLVAGEIAAVFGQGITNVTGILTAGSLPLPTELAGSSVTVNNVPAPIFAVANVSGQQQINFQVPQNISSPAWVAVSNNGVYSSPVAVNVNAVPGIFTLDGSRGAIQHADFRLVTPSSPAARGETIVVYATGLGAVQPDPGLGNPAAVSPLSWTITLPTVTIGGKPAQVLFSGLVPGLVALNQLNVVVPADAPSGDVDVVISNPNVSGAASKAVKLAVQ